MRVPIVALLALALCLFIADEQAARGRAEAQLKEALQAFDGYQQQNKLIGLLTRPHDVASTAERLSRSGVSTVMSWPVRATITDVASGKVLGETPLGLKTAEMPPRLRLSKPGYLSTELSGSTFVNATLEPPLPSRLAARWLAILAVLPLAGAILLFLKRRGQPALSEEFAEPGAPPPTVGEGLMLGRYRLGRRLGQGGQAEVFLAHEEGGSDPTRPFAVKVLFSHVCQDPEYCTRFEREAEMCRQLDHPRVVRVHYSGITSDKRWWMVQDFMPGGTLRGLLEERGALPPEEARRLLMQLAEGLAYAHSKGITHRDFKPDNVLLDEDGEPVIADFGMARAARYQTITREDTTLGTPAYMPPEQVQGLRPDHRADLYSLGVVGYQMLAGRLPFDFDLINTMVAHMSAEPPPLPADLPADLVAVVMRLLRKAPEDRYASAQEVRAALSEPREG